MKSSAKDSINCNEKLMKYFYRMPEYSSFALKVKRNLHSKDSFFNVKGAFLVHKISLKGTETLIFLLYYS